MQIEINKQWWIIATTSTEDMQAEIEGLWEEDRAERLARAQAYGEEEAAEEIEAEEFRPGKIKITGAKDAPGPAYWKPATLEQVAAMAWLKNEPIALLYWEEVDGTMPDNIDEARERAEEAFVGEYDSPDNCAAYLYEGYSIAPRELEQYIDWGRIVHDLECDGWTFVRCLDQHTYKTAYRVFRPC